MYFVRNLSRTATDATRLAGVGKIKSDEPVAGALALLDKR